MPKIKSSAKLLVKLGNIVDERVDAIVNAANPSLLGGRGVDGAIHRAAGPELLEACRKLNGCQTGEAKWTLGFQLHAQYIIHAVGPIWKGGVGGEAMLLAQTYRSVLRIADTLSVKSLSVPSISTGAYSFPIELASKYAVETVRSVPLKSVQEVTWVCFDDKTQAAYQGALG